MLILGPAAGPRISAVTSYPPSSALSLITWPSSTTSTAGNVTVSPTLPASLSTVRTSSTDALSCLPPQRTIAYTKDSLFLGPACRGCVSPGARVRRRWCYTEAAGFANKARSSPDQCGTGVSCYRGGQARRRQRISDCAPGGRLGWSGQLSAGCSAPGVESAGCSAPGVESAGCSALGVESAASPSGVTGLAGSAASWGSDGCG